MKSIQFNSKISLVFLFLISFFFHNCGNIAKQKKLSEIKLSKIIIDDNLTNELTYNPEGQIKSWVWLKNDRTVIQRFNFTYLESKLQRVDIFNNKSILCKYLLFEYNTDGFLIQTNFHEQESPRYSSMTALQLRNHILQFNPWAQQISDLNKLQDLNKRTPIYSGCEKTSYDSNKNACKKEFFNSKNDKVGYCVYEHETSGNLMNETWYDSDFENSVTCRFEYEYDDKKNVAKDINLPFILERKYANNIIRKEGIGLGETQNLSFTYVYNDKNIPIELSKTNDDGDEIEKIKYLYSEY